MSSLEPINSEPEVKRLRKIINYREDITNVLVSLGPEGLDFLAELANDDEALRVSKLRIFRMINKLGQKDNYRNIIIKIGLIIRNLERIKKVLTKKVF